MRDRKHHSQGNYVTNGEGFGTFNMPRVKREEVGRYEAIRRNLLGPLQLNTEPYMPEVILEGNFVKGEMEGEGTVNVPEY